MSHRCAGAWPACPAAGFRKSASLPVIFRNQIEQARLRGALMRQCTGPLSKPSPDPALVGAGCPGQPLTAPVMPDT
jgi:hypothetical protein